MHPLCFALAIPPDLSSCSLLCQLISYLRHLVVYNCRTGIWNGMMEWKMEWNNKHTQLHLTCATGPAQSRSNYLEGVISPQKLMSKCGNANRHASISKHGTAASASSGTLLLLSCKARL